MDRSNIFGEAFFRVMKSRSAIAVLSRVVLASAENFPKD